MNRSKSGLWHYEITHYCEWLGRHAGRSGGTVSLRRHHLRRLQRFVQTASPQSGGARTPWEVTPDQLLDWIAARGWAPETRRVARSSVRGFYRWGIERGRLSISPAAGLPAVLVPRALPRPIPDPLAVAAMAQASPRTRLMMLLAGTCGLRAMELAQVNAADVLGWGETSSLLVRGKGGHERVVPLVDEHLAQLVRAAAGNPGGWLFPGQDRGHLSAHYVSRLMSVALPKPWTGHTLRHRAATVAYSATGDLRAVQELLGHTSVRTTERYVAVSGRQLRAAAGAAARGLG